MKTLKNFKQYCGEDLAALVNPVKYQMDASLCDFWKELENVAGSPCGAAAGFTGFIYYRETVGFWRRNRRKIYGYMEQLANDLGENVLTMVSGFNGLKDYEQEEIARALYGNYDEELTGIYNVFTWFALEEVANRYLDWCYENNF